MRIVECVPFTVEIAAELRGAQSHFGGWSSGLYAWRLAEPRRLQDPIAWRGALGLFGVPDAVVPRDLLDDHTR